MSLRETFLTAADNYPEQRGALLRLEETLSGGPPEYSFDRLLELLYPISARRLVAVCATLVELGIFQPVFRVLSPSGCGSLGDFSSLDDIPDEMRDYFTGQKFTVTPDLIQVLFSVPKSARGQLP
ncbi:hypothetical protein [Nannocystis pusilla]|uniref:hypothetical protein n=1 Tax=Nannocystis pusilla TaxID=889268 RepID=UPI003DA49086